MPIKSSYDDTVAYRTKDGSFIRELMHPAIHGNQRQSLAEASVAVGCATALHQHTATEEIYHITQGQGFMTLGKQEFAVHAGDTVCIPSGTPHRIRNTGGETLRILCACCPPYSHDDTELL